MHYCKICYSTVIFARNASHDKENVTCYDCDRELSQHRCNICAADFPEDQDVDSSKFCTQCHRLVGMRCGCCVLTGCKPYDGVCKECIVTYNEDDDLRLLCKKCHKDVRPDMATGRLGTYVEGYTQIYNMFSYEGILCLDCISRI